MTGFECVNRHIRVRKQLVCDRLKNGKAAGIDEFKGNMLKMEAVGYVTDAGVV